MLNSKFLFIRGSEGNKFLKVTTAPKPVLQMQRDCRFNYVKRIKVNKIVAVTVSRAIGNKLMI